MLLNDLTNGQSNARSKMIAKWKTADCVCFDVDSTVCINEAIDDLAYFIGVVAQDENMYYLCSFFNIFIKNK
jgi:hypothetical protein